MSQDAYSQYKERQLENARVGYQVAVNLTNHEEQQMWARSGTMLVANSILIVAIGSAMTTGAKGGAAWIPILIVPFGVFLCFIWACLIERTHSKCDYWVKSAGELESDYLYEPVVTLTRGKSLSDRGLVHTKTGPIEMNSWGKAFQIKTIPQLMNIAFCSLYFILFVVWNIFSRDCIRLVVGFTLIAIFDVLLPIVIIRQWFRRRNEGEMSIQKGDIERAFQAFCKTMNTRGDVDWDRVIEELHFDADQMTAIRKELRRTGWIREIAQFTYTITREGLRQARRLGILSQAEYEEKKYQIFDR